MPFQSQAQWRWAFATGQPWAREWARMTPGGRRRYLKLQKRVAKKSNTANDAGLWRRAIQQAKRRFAVYPSAYANAWAARWYKKHGGTWSAKKDLRKWFKEDWVNIAKPIRENGKVVGFEPCGRSSAESGAYPKCLPLAKAMRLSDAQRQKLINRKRRAGLPRDGSPVMVSSKHLPGKHDQKQHGRRGGGSSGVASGMTAAQFIAHSDELYAQCQQEMQDRYWGRFADTDDKAIIDPSPAEMAEWTRFLRSQARAGLIHPMIAAREGGNYFDVKQAMNQHGYTMDELIALAKTTDGQEALKQGYIYQLAGKTTRLYQITQKYGHERAMAFSKMSKAEQDAVIDGIITPGRTQVLTAKEVQILTTAGLYGNPDARMRVIDFLHRNQVPSTLLGTESRQEVTMTYMNPSGKQSTETVVVPYSMRISKSEGIVSHNFPDSALKELSLEWRLYESSRYGLELGNPDYDASSAFMKAFTQTHTSQNTNNVLGAAIQTAVSRVGPNADQPAPPSFYRKGIKPPEPHPEVVRLLNNQYQQTQAEYAQQGVTDVMLYRGNRANFRLGIPMGPWSEDETVAADFGNQFNEYRMPVRYIMMNHNSPNFVTRYDTEAEYLVLETAAIARATRADSGDTVFNGTVRREVPIYTWTHKARKQDMKRSVLDEIAPIARPPRDYIISSLDGNYDIFYNYQIASTTKADDTTADGKPKKYGARAGEVISGDLGRDASGRFTSVSGGGARAEQRRIIRGAIKKPKKGSGKRQVSAEEQKKIGRSTLEAAGVAPDTYDALTTLQDEPIDFSDVKDNEEVKKLLEQGLLQNVDGVVTTTGDGDKLIKAADSGKKGRVKLAMARARQNASKRDEQQRSRDEKRQARVDALDDRIASLEEKRDSAKNDASRKRIDARIEKLRAKRDAIATKSYDDDEIIIYQQVI